MTRIKHDWGQEGKGWNRMGWDGMGWGHDDPACRQRRLYSTLLYLCLSEETWLNVPQIARGRTGPPCVGSAVTRHSAVSQDNMRPTHLDSRGYDCCHICDAWYDLVQPIQTWMITPSEPRKCIIFEYYFWRFLFSFYHPILFVSLFLSQVCAFSYN